MQKHFYWSIICHSVCLGPHIFLNFFFFIWSNVREKARLLLHISIIYINSFFYHTYLGSIVAVARSTIFGYFTFFLSSSAWAQRISLSTLIILGLDCSWCSILRIAALSSLATFCRCVWSSRSANGLFWGLSNASNARVRSSSFSTSGLLSPASEICVCAKVSASSIFPALSRKIRQESQWILLPISLTINDYDSSYVTFMLLLSK